MYEPNESAEANDQAETAEVAEAIAAPVAEYSATNQALATLKEKYATAVFVVTTPKGMTAAKEARAELRGYRTSLEKKRVEIKAPALERARLIDSEAKRITAVLVELESPIDTAIKAEEERKEKEKAERIRIEEARVAEILEHIADIGRFADGLIKASSEQIRTQAFDLAALMLTEERFQEFLPAAQREKAATIDRLGGLEAQAILNEQAEAKAAADRAELEQLRAAEQLRKDAEAQAEKQRAADAAIAKAKVEADLAAERAETARQKRLADEQAADLQRQLAEANAALAAKSVVVETLADPIPEPAAAVAPETVEQPNEWAELEAPAVATPSVVVPTADDILGLVADTFAVDERTARGWLAGMRF